MTTQAQRAATHGEAIVGAMVDRLVEEFAPERVLLVGYRATGNGDWYHVDLLVVKSGVTDMREAKRAMREALGGMGLAKDIYVNTPEGFTRTCKSPGQIESIAARDGRVLYERG